MIGRVDSDNIPFFMTFDESEVEDIVTQIISIMQIKWQVSRQDRREEEEW